METERSVTMKQQNSRSWNKHLTEFEAIDILNNLKGSKKYLFEVSVKRVQKGPPFKPYTERQAKIFYTLTEDERTALYWIVGKESLHD